MELQCFMPKDETLAYSVRNVDAAGRVWIRQGATCPWSKGWMHLDKVCSFMLLHYSALFSPSYLCYNSFGQSN